MVDSHVVRNEGVNDDVTHHAQGEVLGVHQTRLLMDLSLEGYNGLVMSYLHTDYHSHSFYYTLPYIGYLDQLG